MHKPSDYLKKDGVADTSLDEFFERNAKDLTDDDLAKIVAHQREGYTAWQKSDADAADKKRKPKKKGGAK